MKVYIVNCIDESAQVYENKAGAIKYLLKKEINYIDSCIEDENKSKLDYESTLYVISKALQSLVEEDSIEEIGYITFMETNPED